MHSTTVPRFTKRYKLVTEEKAGGATYTPVALADFVALHIAEVLPRTSEPLRILDPAVGDGELLLQLARRLKDRRVEVHGFDVHQGAVTSARERLLEIDPKLDLKIHHMDFLAHVSENFSAPSLFSPEPLPLFDIVIANPPYVRTQIMGADQAQALAGRFGLTGRVDLYHAFLVALSHVLKPGATVGIIVSNRFMTTRAGASVRASIREKFELQHIWDLGDTKLFEAAVLPAVLLMQTKSTKAPSKAPHFTTIYETEKAASHYAPDPLSALAHEGAVRLDNGRTFCVRHGTLNLQTPADDVWRLSSVSADAWFELVAKHTAMTFRDVGKIRVGVKTCADKVFMRSDWDKLPVNKQPELLRSLTTHHIARRYRAEETTASILYPHEVYKGRRRAVRISDYPRAHRYLQEHRRTLEGRKYLIEAGRQWYEIWVPQDPAAWGRPKLVFRDISERPTFWIDKSGSVVNGDCYWMVSETDDLNLLWLAAAVANSTFIEEFYDRKFNNKLYAGRRRFITQYVEKFPLPDPGSAIAKKIIDDSRDMYARVGTEKAEALDRSLDNMVWRAFGLSSKEALR